MGAGRPLPHTHRRSPTSTLILPYAITTTHTHTHAQKGQQVGRQPLCIVKDGQGRVWQPPCNPARRRHLRLSDLQGPASGAALRQGVQDALQRARRMAVQVLGPGGSAALHRPGGPRISGGGWGGGTQSGSSSLCRPRPCAQNDGGGRTPFCEMQLGCGQLLWALLALCFVCHPCLPLHVTANPPQAYRTYPALAQQSDALRYYILKHLGGVGTVCCTAAGVTCVWRRTWEVVHRLPASWPTTPKHMGGLGRAVGCMRAQPRAGQSLRPASPQDRLLPGHVHPQGCTWTLTTSAGGRAATSWRGTMW